MGSRQDKQPASLPQLLKEQDEIMLLWNVFWRGFEIQPISFYLKQCALTVETFQLAIDPVTAHGAVTGGKSYDRSRCLSVPSERKAESKRRSLSIKDQAQEEAVVGHVPSLKSEASRLYRRGRGEGGLTSGKRDSPSYRSLAQKPKLSDDRGYRPIHSYSRTPPREPKERRKHRKSHVGLDLVETGEPAETVVRLPEVVEQKIPAYLELIGEEPLVATLGRVSANIKQRAFSAGSERIGDISVRHPRDTFRSEGSPLSISGTVTALQSLYLQSLPRLVAPMVLKVFDSKKEKEKKRISPLVAKDTAYYRFE
ncbi:hypothetical protein L1987_88412 [Smallanthus sonchifolius]|nr:hypothetical protein L1987_89616 [Smallanthus sonchifolius]KAI3666148.1 hypothetical protein L1987_89370 [Smallanthus sonchifolius]KAI3666287.1 hypothetical protein L1987_89211 [Smallanthus sonchifolius]KAI3668321.1 hypothetical protein L1987_88690 [Smallanthus sonchifolius]KAI3668576.1 hypothetical protein L1987_88412 [Smallanthus sonchifolius]